MIKRSDLSPPRMLLCLLLLLSSHRALSADNYHVLIRSCSACQVLADRLAPQLTLIKNQQMRLARLQARFKQWQHIGGEEQQLQHDIQQVQALCSELDGPLAQNQAALEADRTWIESLKALLGLPYRVKLRTLAIRLRHRRTQLQQHLKHLQHIQLQRHEINAAITHTKQVLQQAELASYPIEEQLSDCEALRCAVKFKRETHYQYAEAKLPAIHPLSGAALSALNDIIQHLVPATSAPQSIQAGGSCLRQLHIPRYIRPNALIACRQLNKTFALSCCHLFQQYYAASEQSRYHYSTLSAFPEQLSGRQDKCLSACHYQLLRWHTQFFLAEAEIRGRQIGASSSDQVSQQGMSYQAVYQPINAANLYTQYPQQAMPAGICPPQTMYKKYLQCYALCQHSAQNLAIDLNLRVEHVMSCQVQDSYNVQKRK